MRRTAIASLACILAISVHGSLRAQDTPTFRTGTTVVELSLIAVDEGGRPVTDLRREDVTIEDNGVVRDIAFFRFEGAEATAREATAPSGPGMPTLFGNRIEVGPGARRNVTAILLDSLNTPAAEQVAAREAVLEYLRTAPPDTRVAVYRLGRGFDVVHDFADDLRLLPARIEESARRLPPFISNDVAELECLAGGDCAAPVELEQFDTVQYQMKGRLRRDQTLAALKALGDHLEGLPGRKSIVWIGGGLAAYSMTACGGFGSIGGFESYETQIREAAQRLANQGIAVYPVDSKGVLRARLPPPPVPAGARDAEVSGPQDPFAPGYRTVKRPGPQLQVPEGEKCAGALNPSALRVTALSNYHPESANHLLAETTGGRVIMMTNDLAGGIKQASEDARAAYSLGFYADPSDRQWRRLAVRVNRPSVKVIHRQGYVVPVALPRPQTWSERQWRAAVASPLGSAAIHLAARVDREGANGALAIAIEIASTDLHFRRKGKELVAEFDMVLAEKSVNEGRMQRQFAEFGVPDVGKEPEPVRHVLKMTPRRETDTIRLLVRDRLTGRYGTLDINVRALTLIPNP